MSLALPVSIQSCLILGSVSLSNSAQWGQVREAYSMMVMGASALPSTRSSAVGAGTALWARAPAGAAVRQNAANTTQILCISLSSLLDVDATAFAPAMQAGAVRSYLVATDHRGAEPGERGAESGILDSGEHPVKLLAFLAFERSRPDRRRRARG